MSADAHMTMAVQQSHATAASSVAEAAAKSPSVARLASTAAQADATSASLAAQPVYTLPAKVLPTTHVAPCMLPAESASQRAAAEAASQPMAAVSAARHVADEAASLDTASGSMPEANTGCSTRAGLMQSDMPLAKALVQTHLPLTKALVQSSGTGCEDILEMSEPVSRVRQRDSWVTRSFRGNVQSSCTLQLQCKAQHGVSIKV